MYLTLHDGVRLFVDVAGTVLKTDADEIVSRPTIVLLHGGPGLDQMVFRPSFNALTQIAQIVYIDHRGCGRSGDGPIESWNLDQWGDDVAEVIQILGLDRPVVLGTSFGGFVAQRFASRHPDSIGGLVLMSTAHRADIPKTLDCIEAKGGTKAREAAAHFFSDAAAPGAVDAYFENCLGLYTYNEIDLVAIGRVTQRPEVMMHFFRKGGEMYDVDLRNDLERIVVPTLIVHGENDPIFPINLAKEMVPFLEGSHQSESEAEVHSAETCFVAIPNCGHLSEQDAPERIIAEISRFFQI